MMEPKIRLKGFCGEWKDCLYGDHIISVQTGTNLLGDVWNKGIPLLKMGNIQRGYFDFEKLEYLNEDVCPNDSSIAKYGDFFYNTRNTLELVGKGATWMHKSGLYAFNSNIAKCVFSGIDTFFFNYLYNTNGIIKQVQARAKGTTSVAAVYLSDLKSIQLSLPTYDEQRALATFFTSLDNQISAAEKRLASLKQVKAASLQAMFPQEGETTPKLRFKGWEGEWKKVKLGEMYEPRNEKNDLSFGVNDIISVANMYFRPISYVSNDDYLKSYNIFRVGDIAFEGHKSKNFSHGRFVENSIGDGIVSHVFVVLKRKDKQFDVDFWKYYINNERIMCGILTRSTKSSTMMNDIVVSDFLKESILVPSYEEQVKIGNYFTALDRQLTAQSSKISKLKQIKSACLDQMFV